VVRTNTEEKQIKKERVLQRGLFPAYKKSRKCKVFSRDNKVQSRRIRLGGGKIVGRLLGRGMVSWRGTREVAGV